MTEEVFTNCTNCGPVSVYVKDGEVVRIRPLVADEADFKPWTIEAGRQELLAAEEVQPRAVWCTPSAAGSIRTSASSTR